MATETASLTLAHELTIMRSSIAMVRSGASPRVTLAGLQFGQELLAASAALLTDAEVQVVPVWTASERLTDLIVERSDHGLMPRRPT